MPREPEPLLDEAIAMASAFNTSTRTRHRHRIPILPPEAIQFVRDEATCELAGLVFEEAEGTGELKGDRLYLAPVLVLKLGSTYVVEAARPRRRDRAWAVLFFDEKWRNLGMGYGDGH